MPYKIVKVPGGYKVVSPNTPKGFSKKPLTYEAALKQLRALYLLAPPSRETRSRKTRQKKPNKTKRRAK